MIEKPQFSAQFHVEVVRGEGVFLVSELGNSVLTGRAFELVAPLIDGQRSADDIVEGLALQISAAEVYYALSVLEKKGYLCASANGLPRAEAAFWAQQHIDPHTASLCLKDACILLATFGDVPVEAFRTALASAHLRTGDAGALVVVLTDDYLRADLQRCNHDALRSGRPWMLVKTVGSRMLFGPVFHPGVTACWECLAHRLRTNRAVESFVQRKQNRTELFPLPAASTPATQQIACGIAATEIARYFARHGAPAGDAEILSVDVNTWQTQRHAVVRQPYCSACGKPFDHDQTCPPLQLQSRAKISADDAGYRIVAPEETLHRHERHVSAITGAVAGLQRHVAANGDGVMHVYVAGQNFAALPADLSGLRRHLRSGSAGKGATDVQAKTSALCEALERYSGAFQGTERCRTATLRELGSIAIQPNDCMLFSEKQYRHRDLTNANASRYSYVPPPFDVNARIEWTPLWSLTHKTQRYLPVEYCYFGYPSARFCASCSNGCAAGNSIEEAILQGFLELVERDSVALWWYSRARRPAVELSSFDEPYLAKMSKFLSAHDRELWALDLTSDFGIPVFAALSRHRGHSTEKILLGFGAHLDARIAILRAVTELNQMLAWLLQAERTDDRRPVDGLDDPGTLHWLQTATVANQPHLVGDPRRVARNARDFHSLGSDDLRDDVLLCQRLAEERGLEMLVVDQTRPDIGLPVARVVMPGIRHFWPRFASGRLYDAPVQLGWIERPLTEDELNPVAMFI